MSWQSELASLKRDAATIATTAQSLQIRWKSLYTQVPTSEAAQRQVVRTIGDQMMNIKTTLATIADVIQPLG